MIGADVERAEWLDWRQPPDRWPCGVRAYFGHETCAKLLPPPVRARDLAARLRDAGAPVTLVTPFLTERQSAPARRLVESVRAVQPGVEAVCGDWGLLADLARDDTAEPVVSRLLAGQVADPRCARMLEPGREAVGGRRLVHLDGTVCELRRRPPSDDLVHHLQSCWLDRPRIRAFLRAMGVRRIELSQTGQGVAVSASGDLAYSLHVDDVFVTVMGRCPGDGEDFDRPRRCAPERCRGTPVDWTADAGRLPPLVRRDNALYFSVPGVAAAMLPGRIDRLVRRDHAAPPTDSAGAA